jgi:hypothetical protein
LPREDNVPSAIEQIVDVYAKLDSRASGPALAPAETYRRPAGKAVADYDISRTLEQIKEDLAAVEVGLAKLNNAGGR